MQHMGCQLANSVRALRAGKNARQPTRVVPSNESEKQCFRSCLSTTTTGTLGLETQASSQHQYWWTTRFSMERTNIVCSRNFVLLDFNATPRRTKNCAADGEQFAKVLGVKSKTMVPFLQINLWKLLELVKTCVGITTRQFVGLKKDLGTLAFRKSF